MATYVKFSVQIDNGNPVIYHHVLSEGIVIPDADTIRQRVASFWSSESQTPTVALLLKTAKHILIRYISTYQSPDGTSDITGIINLNIPCESIDIKN